MRCLKVWRQAFVVVVLGFLVVACEYNERERLVFKPPAEGFGSDVDPVVSEEMSGTWVYRRVSSVFNVDIEELLYRSYYENSSFFWEQGGDVVYAFCPDYPSSRGLITTENYLYLDDGRQAFERVGTNFLRSVATTRIDDPFDEDIYREEHVELFKLSDQLLLDSGLFVLNGPINAAEYDHICISRGYSDFFSDQTLSIVFPFEESVLQMSLRFYDSLPAQDYVYDEDGLGPIINFNIVSNADVFWDVVGSNVLYPDMANISISISDDEQMMGSFSFMDADSNAHTGEFHFIFR